MTAAVRWAVALIVGALVVGGAIWLMTVGMYGLTLFAVAPVLIGGIGVFILRPRSYSQAASQGAMIVACLTCSLIFVRLEGLFCIAMTLPLAMTLGGAGGLLAFRLIHSHSAAGGVTMLVLVPIAGLTFDMTARPTVFEVRTAIEIAAPADRVWMHVAEFPELEPPVAWYFRAGIAYPKRARMEGSGIGAVRYCEFSTGVFVEPIQIWEEGRLLKFGVTKSPAPMTELSPYANLVPEHLHGYFNSKQGQFRLTPLEGGRTLLEGTTWYEHGLWPEQYWRWWSDAIIHRIHLRVLHHIRDLAEVAHVRALDRVQTGTPAKPPETVR
jgi:hypothetical protein